MHKFIIPATSAFLVFLGVMPLARGGEQAVAPLLVPQPKQLQLTGGSLAIGSNARIIAGDTTLTPLANVLADEIHTITGTELKVDAGQAKAGDILLQLDPALHDEAYQLTVNDIATVKGGNYNAVASGSVTLLQALVGNGNQLSLPHLTITDEPTYPFRAVLLDLARKYHTPDGIKQVIELARLYKIRYLHLNLADDQLFMFPSTAFPAAGKSNQEFARFEPASKPHVKPYTIAELKDLENFARDRGVYLVPELNFPGHCGRLINDVPDPFAFPGNGSTVNIASPKTVKAVDTLLNEVMNIFQSTPFIHLGADEVGLSGLESTPEYKQAQHDDPNIKTPHDLYCKFVQHMCQVVAKRGKHAIVWEEAWNPGGAYPLPKDTTVMVWSQGRNPNDIAKSGYPIVNATWTPLYIVRNDKRPLEFLYNWQLTEFGREGSDQYTPLRPALKDELKGTELCSWEDSEAIEIQSLRERLALVSERAWNPDLHQKFDQFKTRLAHTDSILEKLVNPITITITGELVKDESTFADPITITLTPKHPGLILRYTLDNSLPDSHWKTYTGPIHVDDTVYLRAGLFNAQGQQQGYLVGSWYRRIKIIKPNLATHKPVTVGPAPDRNDAWAAENAVDGMAGNPNAHWASSGPTPQWLKIDLGSVQPVHEVDVVTYWDGSRYYQFTVEVSADGKKWTKVVDYSKNTAAATPDGYPGTFEPIDARYVRVNMLKNSANEYAHIVEVMVH